MSVWSRELDPRLALAIIGLAVLGALALAIAA